MKATQNVKRGHLPTNLASLPIPFELPTEDLEFIGFVPEQRLKEWMWEKIRMLLKVTDPDAGLHASVVAVKGGYEAFISIEGDTLQVNCKSNAISAPAAFRNAYKRVKEKFFEAKYAAETEDVGMFSYEH